MKIHKRIDFYLAAAVLLACAAACPLLSGGGLLNTRGGGDSPFLLQRLHQLTVALANGHFPVRWMGDANYGYGYPFFNYYAPLAFYVAAAFKFLGFSFVRAIQLSQLTAFVIAAAAMYRLGRRWFASPWAALLSAAAYTLAPFHLVNVYVRGDSIAEFWAMAFYPLVILAVEKTIDHRPQTTDSRPETRDQSRSSETQIPFPLFPFPFPLDQSTKYEIRNTIFLALAYAGLIVSHNISAMIFSPFVVLYAAGRWISRDHRPPAGPFFARLTAGLLVGLLLSAWFWLPAIGEQSLTRLSDVTVGYFDYAFGDGFHFRSLDLVQGSLVFDPDVSNGRAFRMGLVQAVLIAAGSVLLLWRPGPLKKNRWVWLGLMGLATLMITPLSLPLWDTLPLLPFTQFPWRFLSVQAFWGAPLIGALAAGRERLSISAAFGLIALLLVAGLAGLRLDFLPLHDSDITAERLAQYEWFTGNIGTTVGAEYLNTAVEPRPFSSGWISDGQRYEAVVLSGQGEVVLVEQTPTLQRWRVDGAAEGGRLLLPTMMWPGWQASVDGVNVDLDPAARSGLMTVEIPAGGHDLTLRLARTPIRLTAELISLAALLAVSCFWIWQRPRPTDQQLLNWGTLLLLIGGSAFAAWSMAPDPPADGGVATWDFAQLGYLHRQEAISYGNGAVLRSATFEPQIKAGETLLVTLDWGAVPAGDERLVTVALTTPAEHFFNFVPPLTAETRPLTAGPVTYELSIPDDAPAILYLPQITLSDHNRPRTPAGLKRGNLMLAPVRVKGSDRDVELTPIGPLDLQLTNSGQRGEALILDLEMAWWSEAPLGVSLLASYRLIDSRGRPVHAVQFDVQPGYGQRPTVGWPAGRWVADRVTLDLRGVPLDEGGEPYRLMAVLYDQVSGEIYLTRRLGTVDVQHNRLAVTPHRPVTVLPADVEPVNRTFVDAAGEPLIALRGFRRVETAGEVTVTLFWEGLAPLTADYTHFVHVLDEEGALLAQHDAQPQNNTLPTSQWVVGEIVADPAVLPADDVSGPLRVGLYLREGDVVTNLRLAEGEGWVEIR